MYKVLIVFIFIVNLFFSLKTYSFTSSAYLVANSAISFFDYEEANLQYDTNTLEILGKNDLEKKLLTYVNIYSFDNAKTAIAVSKTSPFQLLPVLTSSNLETPSE